MRDITDGTSNVFLMGERLAEWCRLGAAFSDNAAISYMAQKLNSPTRVTDRQMYGASAAQGFLHNVYPQNCGFSSAHTGGGHFTMADGAVVFINQNIDYETYCRLGDRADGGIVSF